MLLLTRYVGQSIIFEHPSFEKPITIHFLSNKKLKMRIGIDAPDDVQIYRDDIRNREEKPHGEQEGEE